MTREEQLSNGFVNMMKGFWKNQDLEVPNLETLKSKMTSEKRTTGNQEPCDDCISRQAVLEYIEGNEADLWHSSENELVCQDIKALPPVTPQQKNGKWLKGNSYGDQYNYYQSCVCSYCKREYDVHGWKYCPNCGAKMEVEE